MYKITIDRLHDLLSLDYTTGILTWKHRPVTQSADKTFNARFAGKTAGCLSKHSGYVVVVILGRLYPAHQVVWAMVNGRWPADEIDHRSGVRNLNEPGNLREATKPEQRQNMKKREDNTSGFTGVFWAAHAGKWRARIAVCKKNHHLGYFDTPEEAAEAYKCAKAKLHTFQPKARES